jgi:murein DD-endopeptidase MepM/ murein hydrolase activator NlpD
VIWLLLLASCAQRVTYPPAKWSSPPPPPPPAPQAKTVVVQPGENLFRISQRTGVSVEAIAKANDLDDPTKVKAGQRLLIPSDAPVIGACGEAPRSEEKPSKSGWIWPVDGVVINKYGDGIDIAAPHGTPIWAAKRGTVLVSGEREGYGKIVIVRHDDARVSIYSHNAKNCVAEGAVVEVGDVVGLVGDSGGSASPKVHFEVRQGEKAVNPRSLLP